MNRFCPPDFTAAVICGDGRFAVVPSDPHGPWPEVATGTHSSMNGAIRAAWRDYEKRVRAYEAQDITRSDAQGIVDAQYRQAAKFNVAQQEG